MKCPNCEIDLVNSEKGPACPKCIFIAPKNKYRVNEMWAWVTVDSRDGNEGIPAFQAKDGMAMPMIGADRARVESMRPIAERVASSTGIPVRLLRFTNREEVEVLDLSKKGKE